MSAYSASPPVMQSTTEPSTRKPGKPWARRKRSAYPGFSAASTAGTVATHGAATAAMLMNQTSVAGPKTAPTPAVPRRCTAKRAVRIATVIGSTQNSSRGAATSSPSTALSTEIAGVITPSP